jgi:hypothetical protein
MLLSLPKLLLILIALGMAVGPPDPASAQGSPHTRPEIEHYPETRSQSATKLPAWAEPSEGSARRSEMPNRQRNWAQTSDDPPGAIPPGVPLGGLEWLLAAGLGYGAYRLRGQGDDDAAA